MKHRVTEEHLHQYHTLGYVVLRRIVPTALIGAMRREAEKGRALAREKDANAQRVQPLRQHASIDLKPFREFYELPELVEALRAVMGPEAFLEAPEVGHVGILLEPAERPWATAWHRDFGPGQRRMNMAAWPRLREDFRYFHQVNCALYDDDCTWYVPGSHLRPDFAEELRIAGGSPWQVGMDQKELSDAAVERYCREYVESMPRGICLRLEAGDFGLYRNSGYHLGCYVPYKRRATLHDSVWTPQWKAAYSRWAAGGEMEPAAEQAVAGEEKH